MSLIAFFAIIVLSSWYPYRAGSWTNRRHHRNSIFRFIAYGAVEPDDGHQQHISGIFTGEQDLHPSQICLGIHAGMRGRFHRDDEYALALPEDA